MKLLELLMALWPAWVLMLAFWFVIGVVAPQWLPFTVVVLVGALCLGFAKGMIERL